MFDLNSIKKQVDNRGWCCVVYGDAGIGKSSLALQACEDMGGLFVLLEDGISVLKKDVDNTGLIKTWDGLIDVLTALATKPHDYKLIVLDCIDTIMPALDKYVVETYYNGDEKKASAFMAKYAQIFIEFNRIIAAFRIIQSKGINIMPIVHSTKATVRDPDSMDYVTNALNLSSGSKNSIANALYDHSDDLLYLKNDIITTPDGKGVDRGRKIYSTWSPSHQAKTRHGITNGCKLDWNSIKTFLNGESK